MESLEYSKKINGGVWKKLPPGFRFRPTDEELVVQYLWRKVLSFPLPSSIIPEIDLNDYDPKNLHGQYLFFFNFSDQSTLMYGIILFGFKHTSKI